MFFSWGSRGAIGDLGACGQRSCSACEKDCEFSGLVSYTVRHIYWLIRWVTGRTFHMQCNNCGATYPADAADFEPAATKRAIPIMDRRGWLFGAGAIGSIAVAGSIAAAADSKADLAALIAPQSGDFYEIDLARLSKIPQEPVMWAVLRVENVKNGTVSLLMPQKFHDKLRGAQRDVDDGAIRQPDYFTTETMEVPTDQLQRLQDDGTLADVVRN